MATRVHEWWRRGTTPEAVWLTVTLAAALLLALVVAHRPFLAAGAVGGAVVLVVLLLRPFTLLAVLLAVGAVSLAPVTGGEKELLSAMGGLDMNGIRLVGVVVGFGALLMVDRRMLAAALGRHGRWYLLFLAYAAATLLFSPSPQEGVRLLFKLAYPFTVYVAVRSLVQGERDLSRLGDIVLGAAAVLVLLVNPFLVLAGGYTVDDSGHLRLQGLGVHQNPFSYYLLAMTFLAVARYMFRGQLRYLLLALSLGGWVVLTMSRISLAASVIGLTAMALYVMLVRRSAKPLLVTATVVLAIAIPLTPVVLDRTLGFVPTPGEVAGWVVDPGSFAGNVRLGGREHVWPVLVAAVRSSPVVGLGLGSSGPVLRSSGSALAAEIPHNDYLRILVDTGALGLTLLILALLVWAAAAATSGLRQGGPAREYAAAAVAAVLAAGAIAFTGNPIDYYAQFTQYVAFFCAAAAAAAVCASADNQGMAPSQTGIGSGS